MAPVTNPHNATPQRLRLKPPQIPRLPFSSPMGEEILSPTSDPSHTPPQEQKEHRANRNMSQSPHTTPSTGSERRFSTPKSNSRKDSPARSKWPGLNVITDFSQGVDRVAGPTKIQTQGKGQVKSSVAPAMAAKQDIAYPHAAELRKDSSESTRSKQEHKLGPRRSGKSLKGSGSKGRLDDLKRSSTKSSNLSPSDRAVMIGIAMNPDDMAQNESPGDEHHLNSAPGAHVRRPSLTPSVAPSIVVTPAVPTIEAPWVAEDTSLAPSNYRRPVSIVYSRAPGPLESSHEGSIVPPVPPLPAAASLNKDHSGDATESRSRVVSAYTVFDEEPSPEAAGQDRPVSRGSQLHMLGKMDSNDTIATKRKSEGWWTYIKSPFFPKSPMFLKNHGASPPSDQPPMPDYGEANKRGFLVPGSPTGQRGSQAAESTHTSWTDSSIDLGDEKRAIDFGGPLEASRSIPAEVPVRMPRESYHIAQGFRGHGAASEYYEASLYEMHSTRPYFECVNHRCRESTLGIGGYVVRGTEGPEAPPVARGLALEPAAIQGGEDPVVTKKAPADTQTPSNRFSAAFGEAANGRDTKAKHLTDVTTIEDIDGTPDVQEAKAAPILKANPPTATVTPPVRKDSLARQPSTIHSSPFYNRPEPQAKVLPIPPPRLPEKDSPVPSGSTKEMVMETPTPRKNASLSVLPSNPRHKTLDQPLSPTPPTPGVPSHAPRGAIPLHEVPESREPSPLPRHIQNTYVTNHYHPQMKRDSHVSHTSVRDLWPPPRPPRPAESLRSWHTKETFEPPPKKPIKPKTFNFDAYRKCLKRKPTSRQRTHQPSDMKKRKRIIIIVGVGLVLLIILVVVLAMTLTRQGDKMPAQSQWLNITGYPPIPTGISTVAQPNAAYEESGCVQPTSMWSCALPKEEQQNIAPNAPDQPNFRIEIRFQNGTNISETAPANLTSRSLHPTNAVSATSFVRTKLLQIRSSFTNALFTPDPSPPSQEDQSFIGQTTDKNQAPYDGEYTPFYMSFHSSAPLPQSKRLLRRDNTDSDSDSDNSTFPDLTSVIPQPSTNPDGTASPAKLYPYPSAQPLRLFNRGRSDEHYGFYTYFSRSIFLKSVAPLNASIVTGNTPPNNPTDADGGSPESQASVQCTWTETRFLVQVWTNKGTDFPLLNATSSDSSSSNGGNKNHNKGGSKGSGGSNSTTSPSANDFTRPGSFPYPISLTLDRHGGDISKKMIYCYGLDNNAKPITAAKKLQLEDRGFSGQLVNPAKGPWKNVKVALKDGGPGGIDGGNGGCGCRWENFNSGNKGGSGGA